MFRKLYDWVMGLAGSRHAPASLAVVSFAESSFFPIPPDVMLAPMVLARPDRAFVYAGICTAASVVGGLLGYAIGFYLEPVGMWLLNLMGHPDGKAAFEKWFADWGLWVILIKGATPIPYKLVTITAGLAQFSLVTFIWASVLTRGLRFFAVAAILKYFGPAMLAEFEKRMALYGTLGLIALVGLIVVLKVLI
ncbi:MULTISPECIES: YqaA family protein [unclassified Phenylobacterium]|uniref:YqaA family protein n=1 Tax=unclassified Phenylobacterium TaxID=2640670 RepID=UPI0022654439|nr:MULTISPECIES: YqaA family protein [unclassified Phenylobacterium]MBS0491658.1 DedA family protein [Pseudomonadota bacterium]MCX7585718.1 DedA family protein [Phenylobacterium sp. 58.2.17]WGU41242.1 YqaA family protein [Phenylobacterium sp. NIBR 498073]